MYSPQGGRREQGSPGKNVFIKILSSFFFSPPPFSFFLLFLFPFITFFPLKQLYLLNRNGKYIPLWDIDIATGFSNIKKSFVLFFNFSNAKETEKTTSKRRKSKVEVCVQNKPPQLSDLHEPPLVDQGSSLAGLDCLDEVQSDAISSEAEDSVLNSHQKHSDHSLGGIGNTHNDDKVSIQSHKSPADVEDETLERLSVSLMDEFADGVSGTESRVKESESPKSSSAGLDGAPLSNTVVKSGGGKKNLLLKGLAIDMVSDTFSPLGSRRRRNKVSKGSTVSSK